MLGRPRLGSRMCCMCSMFHLGHSLLDRSPLPRHLQRTHIAINPATGGSPAMPVELRVGSTGAGLFVGCGAGIGIVTPLSLHAVPVVGQLVSAWRALERSARCGRFCTCLLVSPDRWRGHRFRSHLPPGNAAEECPLPLPPPPLPPPHAVPLLFHPPAGRQPGHLAVHAERINRRRHVRGAAARALAGRARPGPRLWLWRHAWLRLGRRPYAEAVCAAEPDEHAAVSGAGNSAAPAAAGAGGAGAAAGAAGGKRQLGAAAGWRASARLGRRSSRWRIAARAARLDGAAAAAAG